MSKEETTQALRQKLQRISDTISVVYTHPEGPQALAAWIELTQQTGFCCITKAVDLLSVFSIFTDPGSPTTLRAFGGDGRFLTWNNGTWKMGVIHEDQD